MSYHIEINEYQRRLIMKALTSTDVNQFSQAPGSGDAFDNRGQRIRLPGTDVWYARPRRYRPGGLKLFSASKCDPARLRSNVSWWRPDCNDRPSRCRRRRVICKTSPTRAAADLVSIVTSYGQPHPLI